MEQTQPYLESIDQNADQMIVTKWAEYLGGTFGASEALAALQYYERIGWISSSVRRTMRDHLIGLSIAELHSKKYDDPQTLDGPLERLSGTAFGAHAKSLEFIAQIAGHDFDADVLQYNMATRQAEVSPATPHEILSEGNG